MMLKACCIHAIAVIVTFIVIVINVIDQHNQCYSILMYKCCVKGSDPTVTLAVCIALRTALDSI